MVQSRSLAVGGLLRESMQPSPNGLGSAGAVSAAAFVMGSAWRASIGLQTLSAKTAGPSS
jgi:hypothetical protein